MRLLHTSDWHLGQSFHNYDRTYEHQCFFDWLVDRLETDQVDVLLVSGDVYDNANPSAAAQKQLYRFLQNARQRVPHLNVVMIAGNHDSPGRLEAPSPLLSLFDTTVVGQVPRKVDGEIDLDRLVTPLRNRAGEIGAWCLVVPFLRPGDVPRIEEAGDPYLDGIAALYRQTFEHALARREPGQAIIALGHCHMADGKVSENSERRIVIGGAESLQAGIFDPRIAYIALGHLHLAQTVGGLETIRYSGSPLPMSFSEIAYPHQVVRFDLDGETAARIEPVRIPRFVELRRIPEKHAPLDEVLSALEALGDGDWPEEQRPYLEIRVLLDAPEPGLRSRLEAALDNKPVRLARIDSTYARSARAAESEILSAEELHRLQPEDIFQGLYRSRFDADAPEDLRRAFHELLVDPVDEAMP